MARRRIHRLRNDCDRRATQSQIPANRDPNFYDLGLCGPERTDFKDRGEYCGLFKTPSLRNVAPRKSFFHNGVVFHTLREAVAFYATRDTNPEQWYPRNPDGSIRKYDDLPAQSGEHQHRSALRPGGPVTLPRYPTVRSMTSSRS